MQIPMHIVEKIRRSDALLKTKACIEEEVGNYLKANGLIPANAVIVSLCLVPKPEQETQVRGIQYLKLQERERYLKVCFD